MDSEVFSDAKDWEEIVKKFEKKFERVSSEKEREICTQAQKIKKLEEVQLKQNEIERLSKALQRADQRNGELHTDTRQLRKSLEDAEMKIRLERRKMSKDKTEKEKHEKFILELRKSRLKRWRETGLGVIFRNEEQRRESILNFKNLRSVENIGERTYCCNVLRNNIIL